MFFDYANDLNTAGQVIGEPALAREKPGVGWGYGVGLHAKTEFGLVRGEFAYNREGNFIFNFTVGERF